MPDLKIPDTPKGVSGLIPGIQASPAASFARIVLMFLSYSESEAVILASSFIE